MVPDPDHPQPGSDHTLVFLGGLHRSGTSLAFRLLRQHPLASGFSGTAAHEDEGQHLQTVYQPAKAFGGEGRFGFHPDAHLVEVPPVVARAEAQTLFAQWAPYWDLRCPVLIEKSPPNLIRTRYLQSLFPHAHFVVITRHPLEVALAQRKRTGGRPLWSLLRHWFACYDTLSADAPRIHRLLLVRYEDLLTAPQQTLDELLGFVGLSPAPEAVAGEVSAEPSDRYRAEWERLAFRPWYRPYARLLVRRFEAEARRYGYSMREWSAPRSPSPGG
ncbi:MAG: sulfotransferase family protein [Acidimicrobiales bacterium]